MLRRLCKGNIVLNHLHVFKLPRTTNFGKMLGRSKRFPGLPKKKMKEIQLITINRVANMQELIKNIK